MFFNDDEVIFYHNYNQLISKIQYFTKHADKLKLLTEKGHQKAFDSGYDYTSNMSKILNQILD